MDKRGSINRPPVLDGSNYDYWKARMVAFLKSMDQKAWRAIITGWNHPIVTAAYGSTSPKRVADWSPEEETEASGNSKALNAIFNGVDKNMFKLINTVLKPRKLGKFFKLHMKEPLKFECQSCNFSPQNLRT
ncbi:gag-protease polyprotein [Trifolium repens]|nr:gag-protease polyprotein [Trifolium repens]